MGRSTSGTARPLREEEYDLIAALLSGTQSGISVSRDAPVIDMRDGGMGGIRFVNVLGRWFSKEVASAKYTDSDGVLVSISLNVDNCGEPFEVDFWKMDFSPLKRYPRAEDLVVSRLGNSWWGSVS